MRRLLIILLILISSYFMIKYSINLYEMFFIPKEVVLAPPPPPIGIEAGPIKVNINDSTPWESIIKLISTILVTYLGIKVINKYVK